MPPHTITPKDCKACESCACRLLARREHSTLELKRKLHAKEFLKTDITSVIERLYNNGLQSDQRFAECYTRMRIGRGCGPVRLRLELRERGVAEELINDALKPYADKWTSIAERIYHKRFGSEDSEDAENGRGDGAKKYSITKQKQIRFLIHKGFDNEQINKMLTSIAALKPKFKAKT